MLIGVTVGILCVFASSTLKRGMGYDDSLDVFGVHGVGGYVRAILTGVFTAEMFGGSGLDNGIGSELGTQFIGATATLVYSGVMTFIIAKVLDSTIGLRGKGSGVRRERVAYLTTPSARNPVISSTPNPASRNTSSVC